MGTRVSFHTIFMINRFQLLKYNIAENFIFEKIISSVPKYHIFENIKNMCYFQNCQLIADDKYFQN